MPKAPDPLVEFVCDQLRDWAPVTARRLFSAWGIYHGPIMFGLVARDTIYFRVDDENRPDYVAAATKPFMHTARRRLADRGEIGTGPKAFSYQMPSGKIIEMAYYEVPAEILDDTEELGHWAAKALAAARRVKAAKDRPKKKAAARPAAKTPRPHQRSGK